MKNALLSIVLFVFGFVSVAPASAAEPPAVLIVVTNHDTLGDTGEATGFYLSEVSHPWEIFRAAGFTIAFASPQGGEAKLDPKSLDKDDPANAAFLNAYISEAHTLTTEKIADVSVADYDAVFVAGGHGTMWDLPDHEPLQQLLTGVYEAGGVVAAVCHGPAALVNVRLSSGDYLVAGKRVAGFTNDEEDAVGLTDEMPFLLETVLRDRGAEFVPAENFSANVVVSERLVTGQNPASAHGTAEAVAELIGSD